MSGDADQARESLQRGRASTLSVGSSCTDEHETMLAIDIVLVRLGPNRTAIDKDLSATRRPLRTSFGTAPCPLDESARPR